MVLEVFVVIRCWVESPINPKKGVSVQISKVPEPCAAESFLPFGKAAVGVGHHEIRGVQ